jgi:hypothetical protein
MTRVDRDPGQQRIAVSLKLTGLRAFELGHRCGTINGTGYGAGCGCVAGGLECCRAETRDTGLKHPLMSGIADARFACDPVGKNSDPRLDHAEEGSSSAAPAVLVQGRGAVGGAG